MYSNFIKSIFGPDVFCIKLVERVFFEYPKTNEIFIIDDWRIQEDIDFIENSAIIKNSKLDISLIKVYLSKVDKINNNLSATSNTLEGLIDRESCDIVFEFNKDWSNTDELSSKILEHLKNIYVNK